MSMKVGITTSGCDLKSGMSRYISNLIAQFAAYENGDSFEVFAHRHAVDELITTKTNSGIQCVEVAEWLASPVLNIAWHQTALPLKSRKAGFDALFLPAASRRAPLWAPCPTIGTVHDLAPFHLSEKYDLSRTFYQKKVIPIFLKRLTHIIAISESTKRDLETYCGVPDERITVVYHAADTTKFYPRDKETASEAVRGYGIRQPYIVYTSRIENPAKNHLRLIRAFEKIKKEEGVPHQLVLAGADWHGADEVHKVVAQSPYSEDILLTGYVAGEDLPNLYCGADLFVFPSLFEGFGLPILEAMSCGVPVACSNLSSMPEIAGDAAVLFDPFDVDSIARQMLTLLLSEEKRSDFSRLGIRRASDFSWEKTARKTVDVFRQVVGGKRHRP